MSHLDELPEMTDIQKANYDAIQARQNPSADKLLGLYFPVLDHGFISLKDYSGADTAIVRAARTSYQHGVSVRTDDRSLIRYLLKHNHGTPFEFVNFTFHCQIPIMVARQWIRHRIGGFNEMSGRYSIMPLQFYSPEFENFRKQSSNNKQGRDGEINLDYFLENRIRSDTTRDLIKENYIQDLQNDVSRELARIDLPLSTYTNWYWTVNLRSLLHFLSLRCDYHAQWEIRQYANIIAGMVKEVCPLAFEAWQDYTYEAEQFSYQEMVALVEIVGNDSCTSWEESLLGELDKYGLSKREATEFKAKILKFLQQAKRQDFTLDLSQAKPPEYFRQEAEKYVPEIK